MNLKELKELLQLLDDKDITDFELEEGGMKLRVHKAQAGGTVFAPAASAAPTASLAAAPPVPAPPSPAAAPALPEPAAEPAAEEPGTILVKSPIVGTFYRSPDPNAAPFVDVGDRVKPGQVLCIVEAMKLMNEIEAESSGTILKVHPESGQPVQYGEPLFTLRLD